MKITISLPPETEERLRAQAEATGKDIGTLVLEAVEARLSLAQLKFRDILAPVHEDFHKSGLTETELDALLEDGLAEARAETKARSGSPP